MLTGAGVGVCGWMCGAVNRVSVSGDANWAGGCLWLDGGVVL